MKAKDEALNLDEVYNTIFPDNIYFMKSTISNFPACWFIDDVNVNCAFFMPSENISNTIRIWLSENVKDDLFLIANIYTCDHGVNLLFVNPEEAAMFILQWGDKIRPVT